ncbi:FAD-dependent oxidoreductase [Comamonadaceae bacterium G21597-S1]|nr:FAD-dependent oxidoreductase [Comamonadaceae bacterium G21597-S1]
MSQTATVLRSDIVIIGGGAGGLELAARLGRKLGREAVLLIDRAAIHIWKPTLHEVAAGTMDAHAEGLSYPILARRNRFSFALGEMVGLDAAARLVTLAAIRDADGVEQVPQRRVAFDTLVLALGSGSNFFGTPGAEHAHVLEQASDAEAFHRTLLAAFMRAAFSADKQMRMAIVGGGATGVELSAELLEAHDEVLQSIAPNQHFRLDIALVEAAPRILAGLPERISRQADAALRRRGVRVLTDTKVTEIHSTGLRTSAGELPADLVVWAAGIKAAPGNRDYGLEVNRSNQFVVNAKLQTSAPSVYAMGDCAACAWREDALVPARAQAAHQQAEYLARSLVAQQAGAEYAPEFRYRDFGSLVSLGENRGVGNLMGALSGRNFFVDGLIAKWMYMSLHLMHHRAILGAGATAVLALARLLQRRVSGRVKLH